MESYFAGLVADQLNEEYKEYYAKQTNFPKEDFLNESIRIKNKDLLIASAKKARDLLNKEAETYNDYNNKIEYQIKKINDGKDGHLLYFIKDIEGQECLENINSIIESTKREWKSKGYEVACYKEDNKLVFTCSSTKTKNVETKEKNSDVKVTDVKVTKPDPKDNIPKETKGFLRKIRKVTLKKLNFF